MTEDPFGTATALWRVVEEAASRADAGTLLRAAGCVAVGAAQAVRSALEPRHRAVAEALAGGAGPAPVLGLDRTGAPRDAAGAGAYLMHARLADDSFRVAAHPGLAVVPVALALAGTGSAPMSGERVLRAVVGGYECACRLAERLLPEVARRGWRVTSVVAPPAAAATAALMLGLGGEAAAAAIGLAAAASGGPLGVVGVDGDDWRLQPALVVPAGVTASLAAAAGLRTGSGALAGQHGVLGLLGGAGAEWRGGAAVHRVTFKRHPVAMFGQSIHEALGAAPPLTGRLAAVRVDVAPFAAGYSDGSRSSIASVEGIVVSGLRTFHPRLLVPPEAPIEVVGDPGLAELRARLRVTLEGGRVVDLVGDGDTSRWTPCEFRRHCAEVLGETGAGLYDAVAGLVDAPGLADLQVALERAVSRAEAVG